MLNDGPKRQGRFLKKGSKVLDKVSLMEFRFDEITDAKVVAPDNSRRTIIHSQYHDTTELDTCVRPPEKFNDSLIDQEQMRSVIMPVDFTTEWERTRTLRKDRRRSEDEEFDYDFENAQREERERAEAEAEAAQAAQPAGFQAGLGTAPASPGAAPTAPANLKSQFKTQFDAVDAMSQVIPNMKVTAADPTAAGVPPSAAGQGNGGRGAAPQAAPQAAPAAQAAAPTPPARSPDDFIPVAPAAAPAPGAPVRDLEAEAAQEYRQRLAELQESQKHLEEEAQKLREAAKADGYRDGFRMGEEKAELQARQQAAQVFGKVNELIGEFSGLKHAILDNVQQNFYELCQAMAEALLKREFSIKPETFVTVMRRAIDEAASPGKVRIRVHPDFYDKIVGLGGDAGEIKQSLVKDPEVPPGDFKVESDQSIVDVSVGKLIEGLLAKADLSLFDQEEQGEKAS